MKKISICLGTLLFAITCNAQVINTATMDTTGFNYQGKVVVSAYIDSYYGYDFNKPASGERSYFVSMARHNEMTINLAYVDVKYSSSRLRARFVPGFGSYVNANYVNEPGTLKNFIEASVGIRLSDSKNIWLDAGILGSPYTNESAISKDHLMYTRSFAPEYVPYYLSGVKLTVPVSTKTNVYLYLLNGWQQIVDQNKGKSLGTQVEFRPNNNLLLNWNTYIGDERSTASPQFRTRYFSDVFFIYAKNRISATGCLYGGSQDMEDSGGAKSSKQWWQANLIGKYSFNDRLSLSGRIEYFSDPSSVMIVPVVPNVNGFSSYSTGLCLNVQVASNVMARFEGRSFFSEKEVYLNNDNPSRTSNLLISNLTIWF